MERNSLEQLAPGRPSSALQLGPLQPARPARPDPARSGATQLGPLLAAPRVARSISSPFAVSGAPHCFLPLARLTQMESTRRHSSGRLIILVYNNDTLK